MDKAAILKWQVFSGKTGPIATILDIGVVNLFQHSSSKFKPEAEPNKQFGTFAYTSNM